MCDENCITRRNFIGVAAAAGVSAASSVALAVPAKVKLALDDSNIIQSYVRFPNGHDMINGYLARPKAPGRHKVVLTMCGPPGLPTIVRNAAAILAEAGFVGLAVSWSTRTNDQFPDRSTICTDAFMQRWMDDTLAGLAFLRQQPFVAAGKAGAVGFCGGGIAALTFAARTNDLGAIVAYYARPERLPHCREPRDTRQGPIELIDKLKAPVQFHYGAQDESIPPDSINALRKELRRNHNKASIFIYEGATHAFHDIDIPEAYNPSAEKLSWKRALPFLRKNLS